MKKVSGLYIVATMIALVFIYSSCRKAGHSTNPTPGNYRINSYTKITNYSILFPPATVKPPVTESYSFFYNTNNRLSKIIYTTNDSNVTTTKRSLIITFDYLDNKIYKTSTDANTKAVVELDTFIQDGNSMITNAYFPSLTNVYNYYGKLLARETLSTRDTNTVITANMTYTSNNGDFLNRNFDGTLTVNFPDIGKKPFLIFPDSVWDTALSLPLTVVWTSISPTGVVTTTQHDDVYDYKDVLSGYNGNTIMVDAVDANGVTVRTGHFAGGIYTKQFYQIYDFLLNRPGDYLQLESFKTYGVNVYQNQHMVKSITSPFATTTVTYKIDADSKVTQTEATIKDNLGNTTISTYKLQYQTY
jgi:hypothetical protein